MNLYKNCKNSHNLELEGRSVRLGTLYGYRKAEDPEIRDEQEGICSFTIDIPGRTSVSLDNFNTILSGGISFGSRPTPRVRGGFSIHVHNLKTGAVSYNDIELLRCQVQVDRFSPNSFLFCMSIGNSPPTVSSSYEGHWHISHSRISEFSKGLEEALLARIKLDPSVVNGLDKNMLDKIKIESRSSRVIYMDRTLTTKSLGMLELNDVLNRMKEISFTKPIRFSPESEFRIMLEVTDGTVYYEPSSKYLDLDADFADPLLIRGTA